MEYLVSRLKSGRAIFEDPPQVKFPRIFVGEYAAYPGAVGVWEFQRIGKGKKHKKHPETASNGGFRRVFAHDDYQKSSCQVGKTDDPPQPCIRQLSRQN